jgi:hypothetical protein
VNTNRTLDNLHVKLAMLEVSVTKQTQTMVVLHPVPLVHLIMKRDKVMRAHVQNVLLVLLTQSQAHRLEMNVCLALLEHTLTKMVSGLVCFGVFDAINNDDL